MIKSKKRILIYRIGSLGDTIIALPVFNKVREAFPDAEITLLANRPIMSKAPTVESVLGNTYFFDRVINYPTGTRNLGVLFSLWKEIRSHKIDVFINLSTTRGLKNLWLTKVAVIRDFVFFRSAGIPKLVGFPSIKADYLLSIDPATNEFEWEAKRLARRIKSLGPINIDGDYYWNLHFSEQELSEAERFLNPLPFPRNFIAVSAGTKMQSKDWEETNWINLLKQLKSTLKDYQLIMVGAPDEAERADKCIEVWGAQGINLCGKTPPRISGAILKQAQLFIGHDSGPMHLAAAVGTPCVAIFSSRNLPRQWYPRGNSNTILYHKVDCAGCDLEVCIEQKKKCIMSITIAEVKNSALTILAKKDSKILQP